MDGRLDELCAAARSMLQLGMGGDTSALLHAAAALLSPRVSAADQAPSQAPPQRGPASGTHTDPPPSPRRHMDVQRAAPLAIPPSPRSRRPDGGHGLTGPIRVLPARAACPQWAVLQPLVKVVEMLCRTQPVAPATVAAASALVSTLLRPAAAGASVLELLLDGGGSAGAPLILADAACGMVATAEVLVRSRAHEAFPFADKTLRLVAAAGAAFSARASGRGAASEGCAAALLGLADACGACSALLELGLPAAVHVAVSACAALQQICRTGHGCRAFRGHLNTHTSPLSIVLQAAAAAPVGGALLRRALTCLQVASEDLDVCWDLLGDGAVPLVLGFIGEAGRRPSEAASLRSTLLASAGLLQNMARDPRCLRAMQGCGVVETLVDVLVLGGAPKGEADDACEVQVAAIKVLLNLHDGNATSRAALRSVLASAVAAHHIHHVLHPSQ